MIELQVVQGSMEWHEVRAGSDCASEAASALGLSDKCTRSELMKIKHTGLTPDVSEWVQKFLFDKGHEIEALARPIVETRLGKSLFPITAISDDKKFLASLDGIVIEDDMVTIGDLLWENKSMNQKLLDFITSNNDLPDTHWPQCEQQLLVTGALKVYFTVSDGTEEGTVGIFYESKPERRKQLIAGWQQFNNDLAAYVPSEVIHAAIATPTLDLPVVSIQTSGTIAIRSNLRAFGEALNSFIERLPTKPSTDQEFADCKAALTKLKTAEETLDSEESRALSQMTEIDEMRREKKLYQDLARTTRLALEKLVSARESAIKIEIMQEGKDKLTAHITTLNKRLGRVQMPSVAADFNGAIKNKRTVESLRNAVDTELARAKIAANEIADNIQINLGTLDEHKEFSFLFNDVATLVMKAKDDLYNVIKLRISEHQAEQQKKLDDERAKIRSEEEAKAAQKVKDDAEKARQAAEAAATPVVAVVPEQTHAGQAIEATKMQASTPACDSYQPVIQPNANLIEPIFAKPIGQQPNIFFKTQALVVYLDENDFSSAEIDLMQHYAERIVIERQAAA